MRRYVTARRLVAVAATLTDRDRAIWQTLATVRVATASQLLALHGADITARRGRAVLTSLTSRQVLARLPRSVGGVRAGSAGYVYTLGPVGTKLATSSGRHRPWEVGMPFLAHSLSVTQLYTELVLSSRAGRFELLSFSGEPGCWRPFFGPVGGRLVLQPDAYVRLQVDGFTDHWFIEVDRNTESRPTLARKADRYRQYWQSGTEQARTGVFPRVLFLVPDDARREVITEVLSRQPAEVWPLFVVARTDEAVERLVQGAGV